MNSETRRGGLKTRATRPELFRQAIEKAEAEGASRGEMVLRLTARDSADLKRDRSVAVEDISFAGGEMRFLGVKVITGGIEASALEPHSSLS